MFRVLRRLDLTEVYDPFDHMIEIGPLGGQYDLDLERAALSIAFAYHTFDLLLRRDADLFQKFSHRHVELILVHDLVPFLDGCLAKGSLI